MMKKTKAPASLGTEVTFTSSYLDEKYFYCKHPSGLDIYVFPKKMTSSYAFLGTRFGSVDNTFKTSETDDFITLPDGVAHFLEHKLFINEDGSDSFERFSELGGDANAYTSSNRTAYYFGCTENFEENLKELITFVTHPYFTEESINKEIGIISEEIRMYEDNPYDRCYYGMLDGLYEKHSVKRNICGSESSIKKITPELLYECHKVFYAPSNMVLAVCGDVALADVLKIADKLLPESNKKHSIILSNENLSEPREAHKKLVEARMNVSKPLFNIGIKDTNIPKTAEGIFKKEILMMILNDIIFSESSELYSDLLDREIIYPDMRHDYSICQSFAFNSIYGKADDPELVKKEILSYIDKLTENGIPEDDLERAKRVILAEYVKMFDSTARVANELFSYGCDGTQLFLTASVIEAATTTDMHKLLKEAFREEFFTLSVVHPI